MNTAIALDTYPQFEEDFAEVLALNESLLMQMKTHPLHEAFAEARPSRQLIEEFAGLQYVDSVLWVPMLAVMKDRVKNEDLYKALLDNLLCEAGAHHQSHVMLCQQFIKSIGLSPFFGNFHEYSKVATQAVELMNGVSGMSEEQIAGFNLVSEAIVPHLFKMVLPAFEKTPGCDTRYLTDHISVDADDHAAAMEKGVKSLLKNGASVGGIMEGMHLSARTALSVPDALYARHLRGVYKT